MIAYLDHSEQLTETICSYWFRPEAHFRYTAGQFAEFYIPHEGADNRGERRWMTLFSAPEEPLAGVVVRFPNAEPSSFKRALRHLKPGDSIQISEALGDFVLPKNPDLPLLFMAGGIGITPVRSIASSLAARGQVRQGHVIHIARDASDHLFESTILSAGFTKDNHRSLPAIATLATHLRPNTYVYLSGPKSLVEEVLQGLQAVGHPIEQIITDIFLGYNRL